MTELSTAKKVFKRPALFDRVAIRVSKMTDISQDSFMDIFEKFCIRKIKSIIKDSDHPLFPYISFSCRSNRIILTKGT